MTYPSKTPTARRAESKARRDKQKELMQQVNEKLALLGIDHNELLRLIVEDKVKIEVVKE